MNSVPEDDVLAGVCKLSISEETQHALNESFKAKSTSNHLSMRSRRRSYFPERLSLREAKRMARVKV